MSRLNAWMQQHCSRKLDQLKILTREYFSWPWDRDSELAAVICLEHSVEELAELALLPGDFHVDPHIVSDWRFQEFEDRQLLAEYAIRAGIRSRTPPARLRFLQCLEFFRRTWLFIRLFWIGIPVIIVAVVVDLINNWRHRE